MSSPSKCACLSPASRIRIAADVHRYSTSDDDSGCVLDEYAWIPNGVKPDTIHTYFAALPQNKVPFVNSAGEQWRLEQLVKQLPPQDSDPRYCSKLNPVEESELNAFEKERKKQCLGRGLIQQLPIYPDNRKLYCHQCKSAINSEDLVVSAPERFEDSVFWHPGCFVCVECKELLVDLIFFKHNQNVFCGRHHAEQIKPRCSACDELVFSEECTEAEGRVWHMRHFACQNCSTQLGGQRYILKNDLPCCLPCYHQAAQLTCNTCVKEIAADKPHITQGDIHWHASEGCFCCSTCKKNLLGKRYSFLRNQLYCGHNTCSKVMIPKRTISLSTPTALSLPLQLPMNMKPINISSPKQSWPISPTANQSPRVRFALTDSQCRHQPPRISPPPIPQNSQSNPQENIYETVIVPSTSTSPVLQNATTSATHQFSARMKNIKEEAKSPLKITRAA
uniref:Uncharacterized protein n=1 Tax=Ditylenchus dipsaci TaxID=166011 RepID=A0A915CTW4_9BILA